MATNDFQQEMSRMLQCSICMDTLDNPKGLVCQHSFCKSCLDEILEFRRNGGAVITCPLRCERKTFIARNKTTEDLPAPYQLKGILELHEKSKKNSPTDVHCIEGNCKNIPSSSCMKCYKLICSSCQENHCTSHANALPETADNFLPMKHMNLQNEFVPICTEHSAVASYVCSCVGKKFICTYCKQRGHETHRVLRMGEKATQIRSKFEGEIITNILNNIVSVTETRETYIPKYRTLLMESLWIRKLKELNRIVSLMNDEESRILKRFDMLSTAHLQNYKTEDVESITDFFEKFRANEDFKVILKENHVTNIFNRYAKIATIDINLTEGTEKCPLGDLDIEYNHVDIGDYATDMASKFKHNFAVIADVEEETNRLMRSLNSILPEVHLVRNPFPKSDTSWLQADDDQDHSLYSEEFQTSALKKLEEEGLTYIEDLIRDNQVEVMQILLSIKPEIIEMKENNWTPSLFAIKYNNLPIYKLLVDKRARTARIKGKQKEIDPPLVNGIKNEEID